MAASRDACPVSIIAITARSPAPMPTSRLASRLVSARAPSPNPNAPRPVVILVVVLNERSRRLRRLPMSAAPPAPANSRFIGFQLDRQLDRHPVRSLPPCKPGLSSARRQAPDNRSRAFLNLSASDFDPGVWRLTGLSSLAIDFSFIQGRKRHGVQALACDFHYRADQGGKLKLELHAYFHSFRVSPSDMKRSLEVDVDRL